MQAKLSTATIVSYILGAIVFLIGLMNLILVHPVPGIVFLLLSFLFFPGINDLLKSKLNVSIPFYVKIVLGILVIWFTLGVSDLGDMIDQLFR